MKRIAVIFLSCLMIFCTSLVYCFADEGIPSDPNEPLEYSWELNIQGSDDQEVSTRADIIKWRYKTINGYLYRRKYNYSKHVWIGNWEKV